MHGGDEIPHRLDVVDIALERGFAHQQVMAHEPGDGLRFLIRQPQPGTETERDLRADFRMIPAPSLGDVVKQQPEIERPARFDLLHGLAGERHLVIEEPQFDPVEDAEGEDGVFVHGIDVIHVVLHLGDDAAEIGNEPAEHTGFVHAPEHEFGVVGRRQDFHEQPVGLGVVPEIVVDQPEIARDQAQRLGMDVELMALGDVEQPYEVDRVIGEGGVAFHRDPVPAHPEPFDVAFAQSQPGQGEKGFAPVLFLQRGAEDAGQVPHLLGVKEVVFHEALDPAGAGVIGIAHEAAELFLQIEGQPVLGAPGDIVKVAAHRPQEVLGLGEAGGLLGRQHAELDHLADLVHPVEIFGDPEQGVQVAQASLAFLDVGLEHIA